MKHSKFAKSSLAGALLALSAGGAYAHSILNGSLPADATKIDVYRTTCYSADGTSALKDVNGLAWTLPMQAGSGGSAVTDSTQNVVFGIGKTDTNSGTVNLTVAYASAGNVSCDPNNTGVFSNDCASSPGANANNILPATFGTIEAYTASASATTTEWYQLAGTGAYSSYTADDEPPVSTDGSTVVIPTWGYNTISSALGGLSIDNGASINGEYVLIVSHDDNGQSHAYDTIMHCTNGTYADDADTVHTGQGSMFQNQGGSPATIAPSADYDMVLDNGNSN